MRQERGRKEGGKGERIDGRGAGAARGHSNFVNKFVTK